jgi:predicted 3-demethylubiquinone-9 3-methyltransferase (glyoxalase superfamily)
MTKQKISPYLWFDKEAVEAAKFYTAIFDNSRIVSQSQLENTPSGTVDMVSIELMGQEFGMMSAGPFFKINPSISFLVACKSKEEVDHLWSKLNEGGEVMMELGEYPFSKRYGWTKDKFGVSWQIMCVDKQEIAQRIETTLMFTQDRAGKAEEAINFYTSVFPDSKVIDMMRYENGEGMEKDVGTIKHSSFKLAGQVFGAMDSSGPHEFVFNEALSLVVSCEDQKEVDYYWEKLSAVPEAEQCGWLKDKYGVSWQIVPSGMEELLASNDKKKVARVTEAFLEMKKIDLAVLQQVAEEK